MLKKLWISPSSRYLIIVVLATMWLSIQITEGRDTYKRFKRWSTTLLSKPVEQHECQDDSDCSNYPSTSCAQDKTDKKKKCLCADYSQPSSSGGCKKLPKVLRTPCQGDVECIQGAECTINENIDSRLKLCYCREEYEEVNNTCTSGNVMIKVNHITYCSFVTAGPAAVALSAALAFWTYN